MKLRILVLFLSSFVWGGLLHAQNSLKATCSFSGKISFSTVIFSPIFDNRALGCFEWRLVYTTDGNFSALDMLVNYCVDSLVLVPSPNCGDTINTGITEGAIPITNTTGGTVAFHGNYPYLQLQLIFLGGPPGFVTYQVWGANGTTYLGLTKSPRLFYNTKTGFKLGVR